MEWNGVDNACISKECNCVSMECAFMYKWSTCSIYWVTTYNTQYTGIQYSTIQHSVSTIQPNTVQYTTVQYRGSAIIHVPHTTHIGRTLHTVKSRQYTTQYIEYEVWVQSIPTTHTCYHKVVITVQYTTVQYTTVQYTESMVYIQYSTYSTQPSTTLYKPSPHVTAHMLQQPPTTPQHVTLVAYCTPESIPPVVPDLPRDWDYKIQATDYRLQTSVTTGYRLQTTDYRPR